MEPKRPPAAGAAVVVEVEAGLAPKLKPPKPPVAGAAAFVAVLEVAVLVVLLFAPPPKEKPPDVPENGLFAGG